MRRLATFTLALAVCLGLHGVASASVSDVDPEPAEEGDVDPRPSPDDDVDPSYPDDDDDTEPARSPTPPPTPAVTPAPGATPPTPSPSPDETPPEIPPPAAHPPAQPAAPPAPAPPPRRLDGEDAVIVPPKGSTRKPMGIMTLQAIPTVFVGAGGKGSIEVSRFGKATALQPTFGLGLQLDFPVHRYLALGTEAEVGFWNSHRLANAGFGRSAYADIALRVRGRVPFANDRAEVYLAVPVGFSLSLLNDVLSTTTGKGWLIGTHLGLKVYAKPSWGFLIEVGWAHHAWRQRHDPNVEIEGKGPAEDEAPEGATLPTRTVRGSIQQFVFRLGLVFRL
ncbi:MAG: hypothetical protein R3F39_05680 [Myxococcota bacterium]